VATKVSVSLSLSQRSANVKSCQSASFSSPPQPVVWHSQSQFSVWANAGGKWWRIPYFKESNGCCITSGKCPGVFCIGVFLTFQTVRWKNALQNPPSRHHFKQSSTGKVIHIIRTHSVAFLLIGTFVVSGASDADVGGAHPRGFGCHEAADRSPGFDGRPVGHVQVVGGRGSPPPTFWRGCLEPPPTPS
jgi:hypothetical protein